MGSRADISEEDGDDQGDEYYDGTDPIPPQVGERRWSNAGTWSEEMFRAHRMEAGEDADDMDAMARDWDHHGCHEEDDMESMLLVASDVSRELPPLPPHEQCESDKSRALDDFKRVLIDNEASDTTNFLKELQDNFQGRLPPKAAAASTKTLKTFFEGTECRICKKGMNTPKHPNSESHVRKVICLRLYVLTKNPNLESLKEIIELLKIEVIPQRYLLSTNPKTWHEKDTTGASDRGKSYDGAKLWFRDLLHRLLDIFRVISPEPELAFHLCELERMVNILASGTNDHGDDHLNKPETQNSNVTSEIGKRRSEETATFPRAHETRQIRQRHCQNSAAGLESEQADVEQHEHANVIMLGDAHVNMLGDLKLILRKCGHSMQLEDSAQDEHAAWAKLNDAVDLDLADFFPSRKHFVPSAAVILGRMTNLQSLDLGGNYLRLEGAKCLASALENLSVLQSLHLELNELGPDGVDTLAKPMKKMTGMLKLGLSHNHLGPEGAKRLVGVFEKMTGLQTLWLLQNDLGPEGIRFLAGTLAKMTSMHVLSLGKNRIGPEGANLLSIALQKMIELEELFLRDNALGSEGAGLIASALEKKTNLRVLGLRENDIGLEGARQLAAPLEQLTGIRQLGLDYNGLGQEGVRLLLRAVENMIGLHELILDIQPRTVKFQVAIPERILEQGWVQVLAYLRELRAQGKISGNGCEHDEFESGQAAELRQSLSETRLESLNVMLRRCTHDLDYWANNRHQRIHSWKMLSCVKELDLGASLRGEHILAEAAEMLAMISNLTCLNLDGNDLGAEGMGLLAGALSQITGLCTLQLENNYLGPEGAGLLSRALEKLTNLQTLQLDTNRLAIEGTRRMVGALGKLISLHTLGLGLNRMGDEGARHLAIALAKITGLQALFLGKNNIGPDGAAYLAKALVSSTAMKVLHVQDNNLGSQGIRRLALAIKQMTSIKSLNLALNQIGPSEARQLSEVLLKLTDIRKLFLEKNDLGSVGAGHLVVALKNMTLLDTLGLDVDPRDVPFDHAIPEETKRLGWLNVLGYLRELQTQGAAEVREVRIFFLGQGMQGKTSLRRALVNPHGTTQKIDEEDRTVALDIEVWNAGDFKAHFWDLSGQPVYRAIHSFFSFASVLLLLYSPVGPNLVLRDADSIISECIRPWLHLIHSLTPGASIMIICSRLESPPDGCDLAQWSEGVRNLADQVFVKAKDEVAMLDLSCANEVLALQGQKMEVEKRIKKREEQLAGIFRRARERFRSPDTTLEGEMMDPQLKILNQEWQSIDERLRQLQDRDSMKPKTMVLLAGKVICTDSVNGSGSSVFHLANLLRNHVGTLPCINMTFPKKWVLLLQRSDILSEKKLLPLETVLDLMDLDWLELSKEQALCAFQFWGDLGYFKMHRGNLVTNVPWLIALLRPLLHHNIVGSLKKKCLGLAEMTSCDDSVAGSALTRLTPDKYEQLFSLADELQCFRVVKENLLCYLSFWCDLPGPVERLAALEILEKCALVARNNIIKDGDEEWVVTCRMRETDFAQDVDLETLKSWTETCPVLVYKAQSPIPPGFFSTLQAVQILRWRQSPAEFEIVEINHFSLIVKVKMIAAGSLRSHLLSAVVAQDVGSRPQNATGQCLILRADSPQLLKIICSDLERIKAEQFPGFVCSSAVIFSLAQGDTMQHTVYQLAVNSSTGSLGFLLSQRHLDLKIHATPLGSGSIIHKKIREVLSFRTPPAIVLCHCTRDGSARDDVAVTVVDGLVGMLEAISGQTVSILSKDLAVRTQYHLEMKKAISRAECVVLLLSLPFLASSHCLHELGWALEQHLSRSMPLLLISVDESVTIENMKYWNYDGMTVQDKDGEDCKVAGATLKLVRKWLQGIKIFTEWTDHSGRSNGCREAAVKEMVETLFDMREPVEEPLLNPRIRFQVGHTTCGVVYLEECSRQ